MKTFRALCAVVAAALVPPSVASAAEMFVVEAKGVDLAPGQVLDGAKPLVLAVGQRVVAVTADGRTIKLKGPWDAPPAPEGEPSQADLAKSLKGLMHAQAADTSSAGVIRSGGATQPAPPEPWLVDIRHGGDRCRMQGQSTVLWRGPAATPATEIEIAPADRSWLARAPWPADADRLILPPTLTLADGRTYTMTFDKAAASITLHVVPQSLRTAAARAAWMLDVGCVGQAEAMVNGG